MRLGEGSGWEASSDRLEKATSRLVLFYTILIYYTILYYIISYNVYKFYAISAKIIHLKWNREKKNRIRTGIFPVNFSILRIQQQLTIYC